jgi:hypothetical protein
VAALAVADTDRMDALRSPDYTLDTETLDSTVSGSGSVDYYGRLAINTSGSGSGKINSLGEK